MKLTLSRRKLFGLAAALPLGYAAVLDLIRGNYMSRFPNSDHYDGRQFFNPHSGGARGLVDALRWFTNRKIGPWPKSIENKPFPPPPVAKGDEIAATFVGHSTILLQMAGRRIITDPVFSPAAGLFGRLGVRRVRPPGIALQNLGKIDLILLSHNHYDHCDLDALRTIQKQSGCPIVTGLGNRSFLEIERLDNVTELDWWQAHNLHDLRITYTPAQHFSGRGILDRDRSLWGGFVVQAAQKSVYFAGDSGFCPHFQEIADRFPNLDLALIPIGAYLPRWFMSTVHIDPTEAVKVHSILKPKRSLAIHFGTFPLADEGHDDPAQTLAAELDRMGIARDQFVVAETGETRVFG